MPVGPAEGLGREVALGETISDVGEGLTVSTVGDGLVISAAGEGLTLDEASATTPSEGASVCADVASGEATAMAGVGIASGVSASAMATVRLGSGDAIDGSSVGILVGRRRRPGVGVAIAGASKGGAGVLA